MADPPVAIITEGPDGVRDEAVLRTHLHAAHPNVRDVLGLGELLRHFKVEQSTQAQ